MRISKIFEILPLKQLTRINVYVQKHRQALHRILQLSTVFTFSFTHTQRIVAEKSQKIPKILLMHNFFVLTNIRYKNFDIGV